MDKRLEKRIARIDERADWLRKFLERTTDKLARIVVEQELLSLQRVRETLMKNPEYYI